MDYFFDSMNWRELYNLFESEQERITEAIKDFVNIESPSLDIEASRQVADFLVGAIENLDCVDSIERVETKTGQHLIIRAFQSQTSKSLLVVGHTDTVHPRGASRLNPTRIENGRLYGCGVFDMKANCILIIEALKAIKQKSNEKPPLPITIFFSCDEEVGSITGRELVESEAAKAQLCLVCEPSANGKAKTGRKGTASYILKAHGIPAHAGLEAERGASAILEIAHQIKRIHEFNDKQTGTTAIVCQVKGGTAPNVVPAEAECSIDVRFTTLSEAQKIDEKIRGLKPLDERVRLEILGGINRPPLERNEKVLGFYEHAKKLAALMNYELGETQVGGASDGNFVAALGVPVLDGLGVRGDGAHTLEEFICLDDLSYRATLLSMLMLKPF